MKGVAGYRRVMVIVWTVMAVIAISLIGSSYYHISFKHPVKKVSVGNIPSGTVITSFPRVAGNYNWSIASGQYGITDSTDGHLLGYNLSVAELYFHFALYIFHSIKWSHFNGSVTSSVLPAFAVSVNSTNFSYQGEELNYSKWNNSGYLIELGNFPPNSIVYLMIGYLTNNSGVANVEMTVHRNITLSAQPVQWDKPALQGEVYTGADPAAGTWMHFVQIGAGLTFHSVFNVPPFQYVMHFYGPVSVYLVSTWIRTPWQVIGMRALVNPPQPGGSFFTVSTDLGALITGSVTNASGGALDGAVVHVEPPNGFARNVTVGASGQFFITTIYSGNYTIYATYQVMTSNTYSIDNVSMSFTYVQHIII